MVHRSISRLPQNLRPIMQLLTLLGQPPVTIGVLVLIYGYGVSLNSLVVTSYGTFGIVTIGVAAVLKIALHRARPKNDYVRKMLIQTYSFPSGHATGAISSFVTASIIISGMYPAASFASWTIAVILALSIGVSRIYLGAHYFSDVVGGWVIGLIGILCAFVYTQIL